MHLGSAINPGAAQWSPDHQDVDMGTIVQLGHQLQWRVWCWIYVRSQRQNLHKCPVNRCPETPLLSRVRDREEPWFVFISADLEVASAADFKYKQITCTNPDIIILSLFAILPREYLRTKLQRETTLILILATGTVFAVYQVTGQQLEHNIIMQSPVASISISHWVGWGRGPGAAGEETQLKYPRDQQGYENTESSGPHWDLVK